MRDPTRIRRGGRHDLNVRCRTVALRATSSSSAPALSAAPIAYELARRGASVEIVDDRPAGMGATQASAGVLAPYIEAREGGPLLELTVRSLDLFDEFIARVAADSGIAVDVPAHRHARRRD